MTSHALSSALLVHQGAMLVSNDSQIVTEGAGSYGVLTSGENSQAQLTNIQIETLGDMSGDVSANGVVSEFGANVSLRGNNRITTQGTSAMGILAQVSGTIGDTLISTIGNTQVVTRGDGAFALSACARNGGRECTTALEQGVDGSDPVSQALVAAKGLHAITEGKGSYAAYANGANAKVALDNAYLETRGSGSHGVAIRAGQASLSQTDIRTIGDGAHGAAIYNGGSLQVTDSSLKAEQGSGLYVNSTQPSSVANISVSNSQLWGKHSAINVNTGKANIALVNSAISAGNGVMLEAEQGDVALEAKGSLLSGSAMSSSHSKIAMTLSDYSRWENAAGSRISGLTLVDSSLYFAEQQSPNPHGALTIDGNLNSDNGHFYFNGVINGDDSAINKLIVNGDTQGSGWVSVTNVGGVGEKPYRGLS
ncbi:hypothetical protein O0544_10925 [Edwardsiella anguillarum]|nr:hypothetical protein [Edwardsiella anguillarum]